MTLIASCGSKVLDTMSGKTRQNPPWKSNPVIRLALRDVLGVVTSVTMSPRPQTPIPHSALRSSPSPRFRFSTHHSPFTILPPSLPILLSISRNRFLTNFAPGPFALDRNHSTHRPRSRRGQLRPRDGRGVLVQGPRRGDSRSSCRPSVTRCSRPSWKGTWPMPSGTGPREGCTLRRGMSGEVEEALTWPSYGSGAYVLGSRLGSSVSLPTFLEMRDNEQHHQSQDYGQ